MVDASVVTETGGWWRARYGSADRSMYSRSFWIRFFLQRTVRYQPRQGLVIDARVTSVSHIGLLDAPWGPAISSLMRPRSFPRAVTRARWFKSQRKGTSPLFLHTL